MSRRSLVAIATVSAVSLVFAVFATDPAQAAAKPGGRGFAAQSLTPAGDPINTPKSVSGKLAQSDPALLARTDAAKVTVLVKLDYDAAASYAGDLAGLAATSPKVTGKKLKKSDPAVSKYLQYAASQTAAATSSIAKKVPAAKVRTSFNVAYGGLAVTVPANQAKDLLSATGVVAVQPDVANSVHTDTESQARIAAQGTLATTTSSGQNAPLSNDTTKFVGADKVWPLLGGQTKAGAGVIFGDLDTGIWPEHPMLAPGSLPKPVGGPWACQFGDGTTPALGPAFACNNKLIGAYAFLQTNMAVNGDIADDYCTATVCSVRDPDGHGTHTATTAAGDSVASALLLGIDRGPTSGLAPGASVIAYRVCDPSCYSSDSVAAVQQAIVDGVDVINYSIGGSTNAYTDPVELAFLDAYAAGISVNASAGNDGPGASTAEHAGPWVTTVGASTSNRGFESTLVLKSSDGSRFTKVGTTITAGVTNKPVVLPSQVPGYTGGAQCLKDFAPGSLTGKVVVCERGGDTIGRVAKGFRALKGGASGMILYNPTASDTESDNHFLPAIHLDGPNDDFLAFLDAHAGVTATWATGQVRRTLGDVMAGFSSRGPIGDFLKPDVTAPGVQVLAGNTPTPNDVAAGPTGQYYQAIAGTSMSSPHATGLSILVRALHPTWTPGQVKSALMTSSVQSVVNADGSKATPYDRGAGSIRADRAITPSLTFDVSAVKYYTSADDPAHRVDLNLPSITINPLPGVTTTTRVATNVSGVTETFVASATGADGLSIVVAPQTFTLKPGAKQTLAVVVDGSSTTTGTHFGQIIIKPSNTAAGVQVAIPVVVTTAAAKVGLTQTCSPTTISKGATTTCTVTATNSLPTPAPVTVSVTGSLPITKVSPPAKKTANGGAYSGTLSGAHAPTVVSVLPGVGPAKGYLPLTAFGVTPATGFGDETILNYNVAAFTYGGEQYSSVGVDSNGYVVVGGGTSSDNDCCNPIIPNPARPNNVLAPYWTDLSLDPATGGGKLYVGVLNDGVHSFLVIDYEGVQPYGVTAGPGNTFETWIQLGATGGQWFSYGDLVGPNGSALAVGAENRDGTSGVDVGSADPNTELVVTTAPPVAGGSVTFTYEATGVKAGVFELEALLSSKVLTSTPLVRTKITVTP